MASPGNSVKAEAEETATVFSPQLISGSQPPSPLERHYFFEVNDPYPHFESAAAVGDYVKKLSGRPTADRSKPEKSHWARKFTEFIESAPGLVKYAKSSDDTYWQGKKTLGSGSFGIAGVWHKLNANGESIEVSWRQSLHHLMS